MLNSLTLVENLLKTDIPKLFMQNSKLNLLTVSYRLEIM